LQKKEVTLHYLLFPCDVVAAKMFPAAVTDMVTQGRGSFFYFFYTVFMKAGRIRRKEGQK